MFGRLFQPFSREQRFQLIDRTRVIVMLLMAIVLGLNVFCFKLLHLFHNVFLVHVLDAAGDYIAVHHKVTPIAFSLSGGL